MNSETQEVEEFKFITPLFEIQLVPFTKMNYIDDDSPMYTYRLAGLNVQVTPIKIFIKASEIEDLNHCLSLITIKINNNTKYNLLDYIDLIKLFGIQQTLPNRKFLYYNVTPNIILSESYIFDENAYMLQLIYHGKSIFKFVPSNRIKQ